MFKIIALLLYFVLYYFFRVFLIPELGANFPELNVIYIEFFLSLFISIVLFKVWFKKEKTIWIPIIICSMASLTGNYVLSMETTYYSEVVYFDDEGQLVSEGINNSYSIIFDLPFFAGTVVAIFFMTLISAFIRYKAK